MSMGKRYTRAMAREFTRRWFKKFGKETGIEGVKVLYKAKAHPLRRLDDKTKQHLGIIYKEALASIISEDEIFGTLGIVITKIELPPVLDEIKVYWRCYGDQRDKEIPKILSSYSSELHHRLSETMYGTRTPALNFLPDRTDLIEEEMNHLFSIADYGQQYRTVSSTGAILGSIKETGQEILPEDRHEEVPRFIRRMREYTQKRIEKQKAAQEAMKAEVERQKANSANGEGGELNVDSILDGKHVSEELQLEEKDSSMKKNA